MPIISEVGVDLLVGDLQAGNGTDQDMRGIIMTKGDLIMTKGDLIMTKGDLIMKSKIPSEHKTHWVKKGNQQNVLSASQFYTGQENVHILMKVTKGKKTPGQINLEKLTSTCL